LLGLLANVALHAAAISGGLAVAYAVEKIWAGALKDLDRRRRLMLFSLVVVCFYAFALWTAWPPEELSSHIATIRGETVSPFSWMALSIFWGICQPWAISILFWIAIALCMSSRRSLIYLLPVGFFAAFCAVAYCSWWHVGLLVPTLIAILWITWPAPGNVTGRFEGWGRAAMVLMTATQIAWAVNAVRFDHENPYSPDLATAQFLKPFVESGDAIAITYWNEPEGHAFRATGILPYFDRNIFVNMPEPFWSWSNKNSTEDRFNATLPTHPRIVLVEIRYAGYVHATDLNNPRFRSLLAAGYKYIDTFCGSAPETIGMVRTSCHVVFEYPEHGTHAPDTITSAKAGR
jgi:hypothetical protein